MARLNMPFPLTPEQQEVCDEVTAGPRGKVPAPMFAWLRNPELARRVAKLGELLRYQTTLEPHLSEMAILICGRHWTSHLEWKAHKAHALKAGLDPQIVADIAARRAPTFSDERARAIYDVATSLFKTHRVPQALYDRAIAQVGERGLAELVAVLGYYCLAAFTLNTFELGMPESVSPELDDPDFPHLKAPS
jgi:4-carboxymuconolactone decarboxylase